MTVITAKLSNCLLLKETCELFFCVCLLEVSVLCYRTSHLYQLPSTPVPPDRRPLLHFPMSSRLCSGSLSEGLTCAPEMQCLVLSGMPGSPTQRKVFARLVLSDSNQDVYSTKIKILIYTLMAVTLSKNRNQHPPYTLQFFILTERLQQNGCHTSVLLECLKIQKNSWSHK